MRDMPVTGALVGHHFLVVAILDIIGVQDRLEFSIEVALRLANGELAHAYHSSSRFCCSVGVSPIASWACSLLAT